MTGSALILIYDSISASGSFVSAIRSSTTSSVITSSITVPNGTVIDGPIARFKVKSGFFIGYKSK